MCANPWNVESVLLAYYNPTQFNFFFFLTCHPRSACNHNYQNVLMDFFHLNFFYILLVQDNCCLMVLCIMELYIFSSVFVDPQDVTVTYGEKEKLSFNRERQPSVTTFWGEG